MASFTDAFEVDVLKALVGQATTILTTTPLSAVYLSLHTSAASDSAAGTEVSGGSYARVDIKSLMGTPASGAVTNTADIEFAVATGNWGTITDVGVWDALTNGNRLAWGTLAASKTINTGDQLVIPAGDLDITLD